jgi:ABC-type multidrug transport system fused ATPase/permease subunit
MKKYQSGISYSLLGIILAILIVPMVIAPATTLVIITNVLVMAFVFYIFRTTFYSIEGNVLTVKSGFLVNKKIDIPSIRQISETNSLLGAPAASLDRLEITFNTHDSILISPKDKSGFINHILQVNPEVKIRYKSDKGNRD